MIQWCTSRKTAGMKYPFIYFNTNQNHRYETNLKTISDDPKQKPITQSLAKITITIKNNKLG